MIKTMTKQKTTNEAARQLECSKLLTEPELRAMQGEVIIIIRVEESGQTVISKAIVDLFDYRDDHCLIYWKFNIRGENHGLSQMERNCLLLPFSELGSKWFAYDYVCGVIAFTGKPSATRPSYYDHEPKGV